MPRQARLDVPGCIYHVITRGLERRKIFRQEQDREEFVARLEKSLSITGNECHAWVLMDNHVHLLIRVGESPLSALMRRLLTGYAIYFNRRYRRNGYLFQNRYKSILCQEEAYYLELVRYIHLNPVRAGIVKNLDALNRYPWSGHSAIIGKKERPWQNVEEVRSWFGQRVSTSIKHYLSFIEGGFNQGKRPELTGGGLVRSAGGRGAVEKMRNSNQWMQSDERVLGDGDFVERVLKLQEKKLSTQESLRKAGWNLRKLCDFVCEYYSLTSEDLFRKGRANNVSLARSLLVYLAIDKLGIARKEIAGYLRVSSSAIGNNFIRGKIIANEEQVNLTN